MLPWYEKWLPSEQKLSFETNISNHVKCDNICHLYPVRSDCPTLLFSIKCSRSLRTLKPQMNFGNICLFAYGRGWRHLKLLKTFSCVLNNWRHISLHISRSKTAMPPAARETKTIFEIVPRNSTNLVNKSVDFSYRTVSSSPASFYLGK